MSEDQEVKPDEEKSLAQKNIDRMDRMCGKLLDLIEKEDTPDKLKPVLFAQVASWQKTRKNLNPSDDGSRLKEMSNDVKSTGAKRNGSAGRKAKSGPYRSKDGIAIRKIIASLPPLGSGVGGDQENPKRENSGDAGDVGRLPPNGSGHVSGNDDELGDSHIV